MSAASRRRIASSPTGRPSGNRASPSKAGVPPMARGTAQAAKSGTRPSQVTDGLPARDCWTGATSRRRVDGRAHPTLPDAVPGIERGGSLRSRPQAPERHRRSGGRGATAKQPATCTCTSMSICARGTPPTPGDRRSSSAPRIALGRRCGKRPPIVAPNSRVAKHPARRVKDWDRPSGLRPRGPNRQPNVHEPADATGQEAVRTPSFRCADRAVHHRERNRMMARTKRSQRSYAAGEWGRNRVRVFPDPKTGLFQIEWRANGRRLSRSLKHRGLGTGEEAGGRVRRGLRRAGAAWQGRSRARAAHPGDAF